MNLEQRIALISPPTIYLTCRGRSNNAHNSSKKLREREHNPIEVLRKIQKYYVKRGANNKPAYKTEHLVNTLVFCLDRCSARWFWLIKNEIWKWEEFKTAFELKYWSWEVQRSIRQKLEAEKFMHNGAFSRAEYIERVVTLQSVQPPLPENEIVSCMSEHYEEVIQDARRVQPSKHLWEFELLLQWNDQNVRTRRSNGPTTSQPTQENYFRSNIRDSIDNFNTLAETNRITKLPSTSKYTKP